MAWTVDLATDMLFCGLVSVSLSPFFYLLTPASWALLTLAVLMLTSTVCLLRPLVKASVHGKAVLITGCDSGIGLALALYLHMLGFRVFACCLHADGAAIAKVESDCAHDNSAAGTQVKSDADSSGNGDEGDKDGGGQLGRQGDGANILRGLASPRIHVIQLDVTRQDQLAKALLQVEELLPKDEALWGLVNNAGVSGIGLVEWIPIQKFNEVAQVNLFGFVAVTQTFLPLVRRARGRVVNVSSVAGCLGRAGLAPYTITKYGVEGLSDCLREEMQPWGVDVCLVQPGNYSAATNIIGESWVEREGVRMWQNMSESLKADYGQAYFDAFIAGAKLSSKSGYTDVTPVVESLVEALTQVYPRARYRSVDLYYWLKVLAAVHLPEWLFRAIYLPRPAPRTCCTHKDE